MAAVRYMRDDVVVRRAIALRKKGASWASIHAGVGSELALRTFISRIRPMMKVADATVIRATYDRSSRKAA